MGLFFAVEEFLALCFHGPMRRQHSAPSTTHSCCTALPSPVCLLAGEGVLFSSTSSTVCIRALALTLLSLIFSLISISTAKKRIHYNEGGQAGNREEKINNLIHRMN